VILMTRIMITLPIYDMPIHETMAS
jgi:hypothetical protein